MAILYLKLTQADGVVGHFRFTAGKKTELELLPTAKQPVVIEAKMFSRLSGGIRNATFYDQAVRTVACIGAAMDQSQKTVQDLESIGFYVFAPEEQIKREIFTEQMTANSIRQKLQRRVEQYQSDREKYQKLQYWLREALEPLLERTRLGCWSWEKAIEGIRQAHPDQAVVVEKFYQSCLRFNRNQSLFEGGP